MSCRYGVCVDTVVDRVPHQPVAEFNLLLFTYSVFDTCARFPAKHPDPYTAQLLLSFTNFYVHFHQNGNGVV